MKTIALLPFKNEEHILPTYLKNISPIVEQIIAVDDASTDNSRKILEADPKTTVVANTDLVEAGWSEFTIREKLLSLGRDHDGTHFVCLDADETFTSNFLTKAQKVISSLDRGQKVSMQWLALWKSYDHYRDDKSVWSNNYKDFIVHDDGKLVHVHPGNTIGVGRTPGQNNQDTLMQLNTKYGAVLHYQFSNWRNFQLKQAWYRMSELIMQGENNVQSINQKYSITLEDNNAYIRMCPESWTDGLNPDTNPPVSWHLTKISEWFEEYGPSYFEKLNIWHVEELAALKEGAEK
jgi:glycosyltransferase involved in cell wall biosynthesis